MKSLADQLLEAGLVKEKQARAAKEAIALRSQEEQTKNVQGAWAGRAERVSVTELATCQSVNDFRQMLKSVLMANEFDQKLRREILRAGHKLATKVFGEEEELEEKEFERLFLDKKDSQEMGKKMRFIWQIYQVVNTWPEVPQDKRKEFLSGALRRINQVFKIPK